MKFSLNTTILVTFVIFFPLFVTAQPGLKYTKLTFSNDSFKFEYKVYALLEDSLLVTIPRNYAILKKSVNVPIDRIASIKTTQGKSYGQGALKGMLKGAILGLVLGLLFDQSDDKPQGMYHQPSVSPIPYHQPTVSPIPYTIALFTPLATLVGWGAGSRKYKTYLINGSLKSYQDQLPDIKKDLETDPHLSISKFKELRNGSNHP